MKYKSNFISKMSNAENENEVFDLLDDLKVKRTNYYGTVMGTLRKMISDGDFKEFDVSLKAVCKYQSNFSTVHRDDLEEMAMIGMMFAFKAGEYKYEFFCLCFKSPKAALLDFLDKSNDCTHFSDTDFMHLADAIISQKDLLKNSAVLKVSFDKCSPEFIKKMDKYLKERKGQVGAVDKWLKLGIDLNEVVKEYLWLKPCITPFYETMKKNSKEVSSKVDNNVNAMLEN
ncbi:hypothetical protein [Piscirickettsia litoralis]|uniref:RNA polymerase sigma-70 region 2 domain-containing protein n=1 Tax=Piscirickettsia litoralis TaxID=1891921 RepID=A0ABX3A4J3_9GAMM|nr:hypothetical protein [Piscirickettsia litoralis]ODN43440.1 hypothetical protein BGC07_11565 [Piscirickettsia litoralis]